MPDDADDFAIGGAWVGPDPAARRGPANRRPAEIVYTPGLPGDEDDAEVKDLEEALLLLCGGDYALAHRLTDREHRRHPTTPRKELLRLAVEHYRRDHS